MRGLGVVDETRSAAAWRGKHTLAVAPLVQDATALCRKSVRPSPARNSLLEKADSVDQNPRPSERHKLTVAQDHAQSMTSRERLCESPTRNRFLEETGFVDETQEARVAEASPHPRRSLGRKGCLERTTGPAKAARKRNSVKFPVQNVHV